MTADLLNCPASGITIGVDNVVLDCAGHLLDGTPSSPNRGVSASGFSNATIKNCRVKEFYEGIVLGSGSRVNNCTSYSNGNNGIMVQGSNSNVTNSSAYNNYAGLGINNFQSNNRYENSNFSFNSQLGVTGAGLATHTYKNNTACGNPLADLDCGNNFVDGGNNVFDTQYSCGLAKTACPVTPSTLSCGQTITAYYTLMGNDLSGCAGNGLILGANGITLDCAGHSITGSGTGNGVYAELLDSPVVKNCNVSGFEMGIRFSESTNAAALGNTVSGSGYHGIFAYATCGLSIYDNNASFNGAEISSGMGAGGVNSWGIRLANNTLMSNDVGIGFSEDFFQPCSRTGTSVNASFNKVFNNRWMGVDAMSSMVVFKNNITSNGWDGGVQDSGVLITSVSGVSVSNNTIQNNTDGISVGWGASSSTISYNNVTNNTVGIFSDASGIDGISVNYNSIANNTQYGVNIDLNTPVNSFTFLDNTVCRNLVSNFTCGPSQLDGGSNKCFPASACGVACSACP